MTLDYDKIWTSGRCKICKKKVEDNRLYKGHCWICRWPEKMRELVRYGVLPQTARILYDLMAKSGKDAEKVLRIVHPRVMENIVVKDGRLVISCDWYRWLRRTGWVRR